MVNFGDEITDPKYTKTMLYIAGHPDDESFGSGTIKKATERGCEVFVVPITHGREGYSDKKQKERIGDVRIEEMKESVKILGGEFLDFWELLDDLGHTPEEAGAFDREIWHRNKVLQDGLIYGIRKIEPNTILFPYEFDFNDDHKEVCKLAKYCISRSKRPSHPELGDSHIVNRSFEYEITNPMPNATHLIDVTDQWGAVEEAFLCHKSQVERDPGYLVRKALRSSARSLGQVYPQYVKETLNELWGNQVRGARELASYYVLHGKMYEALKSSTIEDFW